MKKFILISLLLVLSVSLFAIGGLPVFDPENWVYSVLDYYNALKDLDNAVKSYEQVGKQFAQGVQQLSEGKIFEFTQSLQNIMNTGKKITRYQGEVLQSVKDQTKSLRELVSNPLDKLGVTDYFTGLVNDGVEIYNKTVDDFNSFKEEMTEDKNNISLSSGTNALDTFSETSTTESSKDTATATQASIDELKMLIQNKYLEEEAEKEKDKALEEVNQAIQDAKYYENLSNEKAKIENAKKINDAVSESIRETYKPFTDEDIDEIMNKIFGGNSSSNNNSSYSSSTTGNRFDFQGGAR